MVACYRDNNNLRAFRTFHLFPGEFIGDAEAFAAGGAVELNHLHILQVGSGDVVRSV